MAIKTVTIEESCNPQSANIFSRTQDLRAATSEIEEAMFNLLFRLAHHQEAVLHLAFDFDAFKILAGLDKFCCLLNIEETCKINDKDPDILSKLSVSNETSH